MKNNIENTVLVSFVVPVYNTEYYIKECIDSILNIKENNYEILLIDDGSKDNSRKICEEYVNNNENIKLFVQTNKGVSSARNVGIKNACGKYITFIDSDDRINLHDFTFLNSNKDLYCLGINRFTNDIETSIKFKEGKDIYKQFVKYPAYMNSMCNKFFKRETILEYNLRLDEAQKYREDMLFVLSFILKGVQIEYIALKYYFYRNNPLSASKKRVSETIINNNIDSSDKMICLLNGKSKILKNYLIIAPVLPFLTDVYCYNYKSYKNRVKSFIIWKYSYNIYHILMSLFAALNLKCICDFTIELKRRVKRNEK